MAESRGGCATSIRNLFIILIVIALFGHFFGDDGKERKSADPEQQAKIESLFDEDGSNIELTKMVKSKMVNPDTFEHVKTTYKEYDEVIAIEMRCSGVDAFGGRTDMYVDAIQNIDTGEIIDCKTY